MNPQATSTGAEMPHPRITAEDMPVEGVPVFQDRNRLQEYLGQEHEIDRLGVGIESGEQREQLLQRIREQSPEINGNAEQALEQIRLNTEQLKKKESFLKKVLKFPFRHPVITTAAVASLLYFTGGGAFLMAQIEKFVGAIPDGKIKSILEGLKRFGGATGTLSPGVNPYAGIEGTPL